MSDPTPMMRQYLELKARHSDKILFFRLGDFYEMFRDDAKEASKLLGLTLTHRQGEPMCGIPYHAASGYIKKLLDSGKRIAVCEQAASTTGKGMMSREVVEVLSPGTLIDEALLDNDASQYLVVLHWQADKCALAAADFSTGEVFTTLVRWSDGPLYLHRELTRFQPREILVREGIENAYPILDQLWNEIPGSLITPVPPWTFESQACLEKVLAHFEIATPGALGWEPNALEIVSLGVLLEYAESRWPGKKYRHLKSLKRYKPGDFMGLDEATARSLELTERNYRDTGWTLWKVLNETCSAPGARRLKSWLKFPLKNLNAILTRQNDVSRFVQNPSMHNNVREILGGMLDWERLTSRLAVDKAGPRDLLGLESCLERALALSEVWSITDHAFSGEVVSLSKEEKKDLAECRDLLMHTLDREPALSFQDGDVIATGFDPILDEDRYARDHGKELVESYGEDEKKLHGLTTLRLKNNRIIGYFFEVSRIQSGNLPGHFRRKQSLVGSERYTTDTLEALQETLATAKERVIEKEKFFFFELKEKLRQHLEVFRRAADFCSYLDTCQGLAWAAQRHRYVPPRLYEGYDLSIKNARHPVVEVAMAGKPFVPNSVNFQSSDVLHLLTGPNMAGKSTYLRQIALIVLMAQIGSYVPAESAEIGLVDQIFCRVGAGDDLARGESTFLVEMNETSNILRSATSASLLVMDEIGRGTSTRDGLSLAWAICEHLLDHVKAKTLFATHYHELTALEHVGKKNFCLAVEEDGTDVIFLRKVIPGAVDHSYGIHVAKMAGLPFSLLERATSILEGLLPENKMLSQLSDPIPKKEASQVSLFDEKDLLLTEIGCLDLGKTTPLEAMNKIDRWQKTIKSIG